LGWRFQFSVHPSFFWCRVEIPVTDHDPITERFFRSLSSVLHFERFKMLGVLPQAQDIIFEVQRKMSNEKIALRKISFPIHKT
jgi:hypothetical protein